METEKIFIGNFDNALRFIRIIDNLEVPIYLKKDCFRINATSLLGILSMNLNEAMDLEIDGTKTDARLVRLALHDYMERKTS